MHGKNLIHTHKNRKTIHVVGNFKGLMER
eukprot:UN17696